MTASPFHKLVVVEVGGDLTGGTSPLELEKKFLLPVKAEKRTFFTFFFSSKNFFYVPTIFSIVTRWPVWSRSLPPFPDGVAARLPC